MSSIYERIVEQTKKAGLNGKQLAELLSLRKTPLTDWKNGQSSPTLEQVIKMCEIFAVSSDYLLFGKTSTLSDEQEELLNSYSQLDLRGQRLVRKIIFEEKSLMDESI